ncbi:carboxylic acid reductase [Williamsia deligens]|uniref:Carboxylic acid reductase n=1 Tax=Williamsia deligens TaxID=321325 RepID=A0ABW3GAX3_9NOCA|nr:carboxylic acid reductase [Williamsia deligens]MCP2195161.1 fatty acid CoA ligase FadD9 [Williamsia deligens]
MTASESATDARDERLAQRRQHLLENDPQFRDAVPDPDLAESVLAGDLPLTAVIDAILTRYADRPALGRRATETVTDDTGATTVRVLPEFETITYGELSDRVTAVSAAWAADGLTAGDFVATLGFTSVDYATLDLACIRSGLVTVPLQTSSVPAQLLPIIGETAPRLLAIATDHLDDVVELATTDHRPDHVLIFDHDARDSAERDAVDRVRRDLTDAGIAVTTMAEVLDRGTDLPAPAPHGSDDGQDHSDDLANLIYTSGSTGAPKGAMYPLRAVRRLWTTFWFTGDATLPAITVNYMPMSHVAGRAMLAKTLATGGTAYFVAAADLSTLMDDIALVRPTDLALVPRVCDMIHQRYLSELDRRADDPTEDDEAAVRQDIRETVLGGRVLSALCGTAPLAPEMADFIAECLDVHLIDGYGSTEAGSVLIDGQITRPPVTEYKLVDVPELGYHVDDHPHPRGELLIKSESLFPGYYKRPEVTAEVFDDDGFYKTGDIMAELGPDHLTYLDRRKNVLKLAQGEFVALSRVEATFAAAETVRQIFVYGNSSRSFLLAVVVPTEDAIARSGGDDAALRASIVDTLKRVGREAGLNSYEIPRDVLVETTPFSRENGLLSGVGKVLRPKLIDHYGERLEELYRELAQGQTDELRQLRRDSDSRPVAETVGRAAAAVIGGGGAVAPDAHFSDLGGDSLSALSFSTLLTEIFGVEVPVGLLMSAATDMAAIADHIEAQRSGEAASPTFSTVHGAGATTIRASDLRLDAFLDSELLGAAPSLPSAPESPTTVLLTGANGYLGRFLCLEWLERLDAVDGTLICIVRGRDTDDARRRLTSVFDSGDEALSARFRELAERRLDVLAGDISSPRLGLDGPTWDRLAADVDRIVHPAALVNHVLPYEQLFAPNVLGTAEIIRLALTSVRKPVTYLSTVGVASEGGPSVLDEDLDIRAASSERAVSEGYANGYGNSKWAGEVLLREAHDLCELPVSVFRSDMILAHSEFAGQLNVPDTFSRLLLTVIATGLAPASFYPREADGSRARAHYDGLPADFTAHAITVLGESVTKGFETYNVVNPHDDGISLDTVVDWMQDAGVALRRVDDFDTWVERFETAIRGLPERIRQASVAPLMHSYRAPQPVDHGSAIPSTRFVAAVADAGLGDGGEIPHLTEALIAKYVSDLRLLDLA